LRGRDVAERLTASRSGRDGGREYRAAGIERRPADPVNTAKDEQEDRLVDQITQTAATDEQQSQAEDTARAPGVYGSAYEWAKPKRNPAKRGLQPADECGAASLLLDKQGECRRQ
jgi:hypothetical protein